MKHTGGRPVELIRLAWAMRFGLHTRRQRRMITPFLCWQLCQCRNDEARRLILGMSI